MLRKKYVAAIDLPGPARYFCPGFWRSPPAFTDISTDDLSKAARYNRIQSWLMVRLVGAKILDMDDLLVQRVIES